MNPERTPLHAPSLADVAQALLAGGKGLLAMDESTTTCNQRFASAGIEKTVDARRAYRELLLTTPGLGASVSGAILYDETIRQRRADGMPFTKILADAGILVGIKVDIGAKDLAGHPGEKVTEGLEGLRERLTAYRYMGARFAKWRGVIGIGFEDGAGGDGGRSRPSRGCLAANAHALARYAALCQEAGLVPIVEPEVLMDGSHTLARCAEVTEAVLRQVFDQLAAQRVVLEAVILKPNRVVSGSTCNAQATASEVADATLQCLLRVVPAAVPGIAFLSGGQTGELATARLNAMHLRFRAANSASLPWPLSFSFARALQHPALEIWAGKDEHRVAAQQALLHRARCNQAALRGEYRDEPSAAVETP